MEWRDWKADKEMVLCYIIEGNKVLLIRKRRGFGAGKVNAPGGKVEKSEEIHDAVMREVQEEVGVIPSSPEKVAELFFEIDGERLLVHVFISEGYEGEVVGSEEAEPFWVGVEEIPYDEMWEDDRIWLPEILKGNLLRFWARFEGDRMLEWELEEL